MSSDPVALLAGPRGRRLCLEFALRCGEETPHADEIRQAVIYAAYNLDPGRGTSYVLFGPGVADSPRRDCSPADVARLMHAVALPDTNENSLLHSLEAAVDSARYWQEPDGEDVLAATAELHPLLVRAAAQIVDSQQAKAWAKSMDKTGQWVVTFVNDEIPAPAPGGSTREILEQWHTEQIEEETRATRERPSNPAASWSGTWWSKPPGQLTQTTSALDGRGPAGLRLVEDAFGWEAASVERIHIPLDARVYEIDGPEAWAELCRRYPLEVTASRRHVWYRATGRNGRWVIPDWRQAQFDVDAIHLSTSGYLRTAGRDIPVDGDLSTVLAGWDPDQTFWLTAVDKDPSSLESWTYGRHTGDWTLPVTP